MSTELIDTVKGVHVRCKDCKHWDLGGTLSAGAEWSECKRENLPDALFMVTGGPEVEGLVTRFDFGCIQFEPKETQ